MDQPLCPIKTLPHSHGVLCMVAYKIQTQGNYPEESIQHSEHGKSLKSRSILVSLGAARFNI
jgi:hypothetical protein